MVFLVWFFWWVFCVFFFWSVCLFGRFFVSGVFGFVSVFGFVFFLSALLKQQECWLALSQPELSKQGKISVQIYGKVLGVKIWFGEFKAGSSPETTLLL